jgi:hypothetical protein
MKVPTIIARRLLQHSSERRQYDLLRLTLEHLQDRDAFDAFLVEHFWKTGVSVMPSRIHSPTPTMTMLSRKGIRHPQTRNWSPENPAEEQHCQVCQEQPCRPAELRPRGDRDFC